MASKYEPIGSSQEQQPLGSGLGSSSASVFEVEDTRAARVAQYGAGEGFGGVVEGGSRALMQSSLGQWVGTPRVRLCILLALVALGVVCVVAVVLVFMFGSPAPPPGCDWIGNTLPDEFEPSGLAWNNVTNKLYVVGDEGSILSLDQNLMTQTWNVGKYDLESLAIADTSTSLIYTVDEKQSLLIEYDLVAKKVARQVVLPNITIERSHGVEGLTIAPPSADGEPYIFYAGNQKDGNIYVYNVSSAVLQNRSADLASGVTYAATIITPYDRDCSGLHYDSDSDHLFAMFDHYNAILELSRYNGTVFRAYKAPASHQEGIAMNHHADFSRTWKFYIADDEIGNLLSCEQSSLQLMKPPNGKTAAL